jgi:hypothetical protein
MASQSGLLRAGHGDRHARLHNIRIGPICARGYRADPKTSRSIAWLVIAVASRGFGGTAICCALTRPADNASAAKAGASAHLVITLMGGLR